MKSALLSGLTFTLLMILLPLIFMVSIGPLELGIWLLVFILGWTLILVGRRRSGSSGQAS